ncbi:tripartite tricarboxylate transporter substrate binding protein [Variovorax sp. J31P207]|uniref:Bug family tripartite tricarboxylate transporter substrate binding protein n=1 Tax=Variovorax sp. J31P207 TaxID=3053510 RepID=UPI0025760538|nr:tripartite tricarboxylate transporter substrate binding protein [Variovorax sp. J31P207]MDM0066786.1 tripartite tricarboxylate transporter substrate binding protein [Variovorax sp. J31P207]
MNSIQSKRTLSRRIALQYGLGAFGAGILPASALAQGAWPTKPVSLVVGYPPGGQTDFAGRVLTAGMQASLGQSVVIDNKPGVNGNIATDYVLKAPPDGYKLLVGNGSNMVLNPHTYRNTQVADPLKMTPIGLLLTSSLMLVVPTSLPVKDVPEFIAWIKAQDKAGKAVDYASGGPGSLVQTAMELFRERIGKPKMSHVPYKGSSPAMTDLIAGRVPAMFDASSVVAPFLKSGQLKALMVTGPKRVPAFPDVPTAAESGIKDFQIISFIGLYGPPGLSPDIVKKANTAMNSALKEPNVQKTIADRGDDAGGGTPEQLAALTRDYYKLLGEVVKSNDIRAE